MALHTAQTNTALRPPVVVVLGHVDHGKSSLLEAIREDFKITSKESGGITQHIGAYVAEFEGKPITFIDTPGHEAFSAVRSRGAKVADLAVLVVAADDGVKPQTKEAIKQVKEAQLPFLVAFNKIDKLQANVERVKQELSQEGVLVESFGGKVPEVQTSAVSKQGIKELLETLLLLAELEDLKVSVEVAAKGVVIESGMDARRGPTATLLVQEGTLRVGDVIATKSSMGKARIIEDVQGNAVKEVLPSFPCLVIGFEEAPQTGEEWKVFESEEEARSFLAPAEARVFQQDIPEGIPTLDIILKSDVTGSLEVLEHALLSIPQDQVALRFVGATAGDITENDVKVAIGTKARIIGFRTKTQSVAADLAEREGVKIETFEVIYELVQRVRALMEKSIEPETVRRELGSLKVLAVFLTEKNRQIVGGRVTQGEIQKGSRVEIMRGEEIVGTGKLVNVQRNKKDVGLVKAGEESGLVVEGTAKIQEGDVIQSFTQEVQQGSL